MSLRAVGRAATIRAALAAVAVLLAACGSGAAELAPASAPVSAPAPIASATPLATAAPAASSPAAAGDRWTIGDASKATVRVREQLVGISAQSDAVLVATGATGAFGLASDGTFAPDSKIAFDLRTLKSDQSQRDGFVKMDTLRVSQFPTATFVPTKATGLAIPLPASGTFTFSLAGKLTIHGVEHAVTFDVQAKRDGDALTATATAAPSLKFEDFGMSAPSVPFRVVSVVDEIRLVVDLVATGPKT